MILVKPKKASCFAILILFNFLLLFSCQKELKVEPTANQIAVISLTGYDGICLNDSVHGTYYSNITPGSDTCFIAIQANVIKAGSYNIFTNTQNGLSFADSGFFNETGLHTVLLKPEGTPESSKFTIFSLKDDSSICTFTLEVKDTSKNEPVNQNPDTSAGDPNANGINAWQFTTDDGSFSGFFDTAKLVTDVATGSTYLKLSGKTNNTKDSVLRLKVVFPGPEIKLGTYQTQGESASSFRFLDKNKNDIYYTDNNPASASLVNINIILYNQETHIIEGLISGRVNNSRGYAAIVIKGAFETTVSE